jgi:hypothetical protein
MDRVEASRGAPEVAGLAAALHVSPTMVFHLCQDVRWRRTEAVHRHHAPLPLRRRAAAGEGDSGALLAPLAGYADQSQTAKDFKRFTA